MRFATLLSAATLAVSGVSASLNLQGIIGFDLTKGNKYGALNPPWSHGAHPGWYSGHNPQLYPQYPCVHSGGIICRILKYFPDALQCPNNPPPTPPPTDGYTQTFNNISAAVQASDYMTYGLVDTVNDCKAMCNTVSGCAFVNTYHDVNGKGGSTQLTCSLFSLCHTSADADNYGGQGQPDGSVDYIADSDGWCKS